MESINKLIQLSFESNDFKGNSNRSYILSLIKKELDKNVGDSFVDKKGKKRKVQAVDGSYLAVKLSHIKPDSALMEYHNECLKAKVPYSRALWGNIKIRKVIPLTPNVGGL